MLRRISGADVRVTAIEQAYRFTDITRMAETYRQERVLLAGDAAHVHSPLGGQGLSLGLMDAANLGWKLAAVVRGDQPEELLDSYSSERRPAAEAVLANTLAQVALLRSDARSNAMREMFSKLLELDDVNDYVDGLMSGLATRYDLNSDKDVVGRLVGDRRISTAAGPSSLFAEMGDGKGILLDASPDGRGSALAREFTYLGYLPVDSGPSMLIRPDGCVAWADAAGGTVGLMEALDRWFGSTGTENGP